MVRLTARRKLPENARKEKVLHLYMFSYFQKKYIAKVKCKDKDAECTLELGGEEHKENMIMV